MLNQKRIFIIEDDANNRFIMQSILEMHGAIVDGERWRSEGSILKLVNFLPIDLITLDLSLVNNISGFDVFKLIRSNPLFNGIPIVVVSGSEPYTASQKARGMGFSGFIAKPIKPKLYARQLADIIAGQEIWYQPIP